MGIPELGRDKSDCADGIVARGVRMWERLWAPRSGRKEGQKFKLKFPGSPWGFHGEQRHPHTYWVLF